MGFAWRAPEATYSRRYMIPQHTVERLRERLTQKGDTISRSAEDLANQIDSAVSTAVTHGKAENIVDDGVPAKLVDVTDMLGDALFAIVKKNNRPGPEEVVLTLLTGRMVERSRQTGGWKQPGLGTLADVCSSDVKTAVRAMPNKPIREEAELRLITYFKDGKTQMVTYEKAVAAQKVLELREDVNVAANSIQVWKRIPFKTRTVIDIEE